MTARATVAVIRSRIWSASAVVRRRRVAGYQSQDDLTPSSHRGRPTPDYVRCGNSRQRRDAYPGARKPNPHRTPGSCVHGQSRPGRAASQIPRPVKVSNVGGYPYAPGHERDLDRIRPLLHRHPGPHRAGLGLISGPHRASPLGPTIDPALRTASALARRRYSSRLRVGSRSLASFACQLAKFQLPAI